MKNITKKDVAIAFSREITIDSRLGEIGWKIMSYDPRKELFLVSYSEHVGPLAKRNYDTTFKNVNEAIEKYNEINIMKDEEK